MNLLHELIAVRVDAWRAEGYPCADSPAIAEILGHAIDDERTGHLRYLRKAQFRALEVYWFLRLVERTPKIPDLYARCFPKKAERREALGLSAKAFEDADYDFDALFARIRADNAFVRANHLESLRETLTLDYPSYILALARGINRSITKATTSIPNRKRPIWNRRSMPSPSMPGTSKACGSRAD